MRSFYVDKFFFMAIKKKPHLLEILKNIHEISLDELEKMEIQKWWKDRFIELVKQKYVYIENAPLFREAVANIPYEYNENRNGIVYQSVVEWEANKLVVDIDDYVFLTDDGVIINTVYIKQNLQNIIMKNCKYVDKMDEKSYRKFVQDKLREKYDNNINW